MQNKEVGPHCLTWSCCLYAWLVFLTSGWVSNWHLEHFNPHELMNSGWLYILLLSAWQLLAGRKLTWIDFLAFWEMYPSLAEDQSQEMAGLMGNGWAMRGFTRSQDIFVTQIRFQRGPEWRGYVKELSHIGRLRFESWFSYLLAVWPWAYFLMSLSFIFLIINGGIKKCVSS